MADMNLGISADNFYQLSAALVHYYARPAFIIMETETFFIRVRMKTGEGESLGDLLNANIVCAGYADRPKVISDVSLSVSAGEIAGLIGANGAGKSTVIKAILGLCRDIEGGIEWNDSSYAYIPERPSFYEELTLWEHLELTGSLRGIEAGECRERAGRLLDEFSLTAVKHELPSDFSKGMQQKLMLIQAFLAKPDIYIIDEPFIGLDPISTKLFTDMLIAEKERGAGILMCTHVLDTAEKICDRFYLLDQGALLLQGTLAELQEKTGSRSLLDCFYSAVRSSQG